MVLPAVIEPKIEYNPPNYICRRSSMLYPGEPDGHLDKPFWKQAEIIDTLCDIEGGDMPAPFKRTSIMMLWDDDNLYVGAWLEEDHIWATVTERDAVIYVDNDFEIFLAPKHTTHRYYELEMNAHNTVWDMMMGSPYRDGIHRTNSWDIRGLKSAVHIEGDLNNPHAENRFWSLEVIIPWYSLRENEAEDCSDPQLAPNVGEYWRANFSRVEYRTEVHEDRYIKQINPGTGLPYPEYNWVWAPTGVIDIHLPELWGYVLFADGDAVFSPPPEEKVMWELRKLFYRERNFGAEHGRYTGDFEALRGNDKWTIRPEIHVTPSMFEILAPFSSGSIHIRQDGYIWRDQGDVFSLSFY